MIGQGELVLQPEVVQASEVNAAAETTEKIKKRLKCKIYSENCLGTLM